MEDIYYFSQGRLIHNLPYKKFIDPKELNKTNDVIQEKELHNINSKPKDIKSKIFNFQIFYPSILRYK
jgi:hypothetical protein